ILSLFDMFPTIVKVLEIVRKDERDWKNRDKASNLLVYFQTFDFVFYLHLILTMLTITNSLNGWEKVLGEAYEFCDKHDMHILILKGIGKNLFLIGYFGSLMDMMTGSPILKQLEATLLSSCLSPFKACTSNILILLHHICFDLLDFVILY
ncbi:hypothetical protein ACJX0J_021113, partial [Zea mays]